MGDDNDDYEVGRGRPPKHTQFVKGQSGNPSGTKKRRTFLDELAEGLDEEVEGPIAGVPTMMTMRRAAVRTLLIKAVKGDMRAMALVVANDNAKAEEPEAEVLREHEGLIERFVQRYLRRKKLERGGSDD
jgi:hypothetical protein